MANIAMLGTGLIGLFYTTSLRAKRSRDRVVVVQGRDAAKTRAFAEKHGIPRSTTSLEEAVSARVPATSGGTQSTRCADGNGHGYGHGGGHARGPSLQILDPKSSFNVNLQHGGPFS
jgi:hypothetical protein